MSAPSITSEFDSCDKYCVFETGNQLFGVLATSVREVGLRPSVALVPQSHPSLVGIGRVRNEFVPLIRLEEIPGSCANPQIVVISGEHGPWGLMVERVIGLVALELSLASDSRGGESWMSAVMGSATLEGRVVKILDGRSLYRYSANLLNQFWTPAPTG